MKKYLVLINRQDNNPNIPKYKAKYNTRSTNPNNVTLTNQNIVRTQKITPVK